MSAPPNLTRASLTRAGPAHAAVAFLAMGGWAAFANRHHPMPAPLVAMLIQGTISAAITLVLKRGIEAMAAHLRGMAALVLPPLAACALSAVVLALLHAAGGTPEIGRTIALPLVVSTSYAALYSLALQRDKRRDRP